MSSVCFSAFFTRLFTGNKKEKKNSNDNIKKKKSAFFSLERTQRKGPDSYKRIFGFPLFQVRTSSSPFFFFLSFPFLFFFFPSTHFRLHSWEKVSKREKKNRQQSQQRDQQKDKLLLSFFSLRLACSCFPLSLCFLFFFFWSSRLKTLLSFFFASFFF